MPRSIALIGTGPAGLGFLQKLNHQIKEGQLNPQDISTIDIFETSRIMGPGLPYDSENAEPEHLLNVSSASASFPNNGKEFVEWFHQNQESITKDFKNIFNKRCEEKIASRNLDEDGANQMHQHYQTLWQGFEKRYLNLDLGRSYHPRILFGMYQVKVFSDEMKNLREAGITIQEHTQSPVTDIVKTGEKYALAVERDSRVEKFEDLDNVVLATGRWANKTNAKSNRYIEDIWPAQHLKKQIEQISQEEISRRTIAGDSDKTIRIAIEGSRLSAIDATKTLLRDGRFITDENGNVVEYHPDQNSPYQIEIDMISRSGRLPKVKSGVDYLKRTYGSENIPSDIKLNDDSLQNLRQNQDDKIYLWQIYALITRSIEVAYHKAGNEMMANNCRFVLSQILSCASEDRVEINDLKEVNGATPDQFLLNAIDKFNIDSPTANYEKINQLIENMLFSQDSPVEQLKEDLKNARIGDLENKVVTNGNDEGNYLLWTNVYRQCDALTIKKYLPLDEMIHHTDSFERFNEIMVNSMPPIAAQEVISLHNSKALNFVKATADKIFIDENGQESDEEQRQIQGNNSDQKIRIAQKNYDAVINTRGLGRDLRNCPPLYQSLQDQKLITSLKFPLETPAYTLEEKYSQKDGQKIAATLQKNQVVINEQAYYDTSTIDIRDLYACNEKGQKLSEGLLFAIMAGGINGAIKQGEKAAVEIARICKIPSVTPVPEIQIQVAQSNQSKTY